jgi:hypothetical protein
MASVTNIVILRRFAKACDNDVKAFLEKMLPRRREEVSA